MSFFNIDFQRHNGPNVAQYVNSKHRSTETCHQDQIEARSTPKSIGRIAGNCFFKWQDDKKEDVSRRPGEDCRRPEGQMGQEEGHERQAEDECGRPRQNCGRCKGALESGESRWPDPALILDCSLRSAVGLLRPCVADIQHRARLRLIHGSGG
jgi:hypothetical protein